ncbi:hypothetical protein NP233_g9060 [Leucocoprinus birnbaumii]|uniref:CHAT domain-containing protein n=1 Tax=Leucocoprinus birnbaumii TaxID=56174 RepID=A0AAD5YT95_9AGAR|nr:hypothetical protein NP233_g9060 [Leucocoprinus birnbaumii]
MDDKAELAQLAKDTASIKAELFKDSDVDLAELDAVILSLRDDFQRYQHSNESLERGWNYGNIALRLAVALLSCFTTAGRKESSNLQEAKELEDIITRHNRNINNESHNDHYHWQHYRLLIARGDLIVAFQKLEARLALLQVHEVQLLDSSYHINASALRHTKSSIATSPPGAPEPSLPSKAPNVADTDHSLLPLPAQLSSSESPLTFSTTIPGGEKFTMNLCIIALRNDNDETEIRDYAIYCQVLAESYFTRYQIEGDATALEEAAEYSVTAYQLLNDIADVSVNLIVPRAKAILQKYLGVYDAKFSRLPSFNILETLEPLMSHFSESTGPPPYIWSNSPHQTEALMTLHNSSTATSPKLSPRGSSVTIADTNYNLLPSPAQLSPSQSSCISPTVPNSRKVLTMNSCMTALLNANSETEIRDYAIYCTVLAHFHFVRYRRANDGLDLEEAAEYSATAYQLVADIDDLSFTLIAPRTTAILFQYLGAYRAQSPRLPSINALETFGTLTDSFSQTNNPPPYSWRLLLGGIFYRVYRETRNILHADMAITQLEKAFECKPPTSDTAEWMKKAHEDLGTMLLDRYNLSGDSNDLDAAINNLSSGKVPTSDPRLAGLLGLAFWFRSVLHPGQSLLILMTPAGPPKRDPSWGRCSFKHTTDMVTTQISPEASNIWRNQCYTLLIAAAFLLKLADAYAWRSAEGDMELAMQCVKSASEEDRRRPRDTLEVDSEYIPEMPSSRDEWKRRAKGFFRSPILQFCFARGWGALALEQDHPECLQAFKLMASLLLDIAAIGNKVEDKYQRLQAAQNFGGPAAATAVKFATASLAVEWLELGISITTRQIYQLRLDVGDLAIRHPDLFETLQKLSKELRQHSGQSSLTTGGTSAFSGANNHRLRSVYEAHVEEIRRKPGMENFLRPLPFPQLAEAARYGPVILLSCDPITETSYAFIILDPFQTEPITILLPKASSQDISILKTTFSHLLNNLGIRHRSSENCKEKQSERAGQVSTKRRDIREQGFELFLSEIWTRIVKPVFDELEKHSMQSGRVWWCPVGEFTEFPLHAAAPIDCLYISSYTYGLEVLLNARARRVGSTASEQPKSSSLQLSVVGIGDYPGRPHLTLPSVARELQILSNLVEGDSGIVLHEMKNDEAKVDAVLSTLKSSQFVHLACHGTMDVQEPLNSHLVLVNGNLELRNILAEDLKSAEFAFLSACQTATGVSSLSNESVHLAGGFVAAGFKGVVGTLWSIADEDAPGVVKDVYKAMKIEGGLDITLAAEGLDRAVKRMRISGVPAHRWVPFIHVGV